MNLYQFWLHWQQVREPFYDAPGHVVHRPWLIAGYPSDQLLFLCVAAAFGVYMALTFKLPERS